MLCRRLSLSGLYADRDLSASDLYEAAGNVYLKVVFTTYADYATCVERGDQGGMAFKDLERTQGTRQFDTCRLSLIERSLRRNDRDYHIENRLADIE